MPLSPGARLGPYEVVAKLGEGGMGEVYRARDTKLERDVAIKVLPEHLAADPDALSRFEREAKAVAALSHPNILAIHDFGREGGVSYAVMELLEGETLRQRLGAGALPPRKVVQTGVDIAQGLAAAHARGVVHRDLKPENVFITSDGRVKILDFGLARTMAIATSGGSNAETVIQATNPGAVLGTVGYMSPEQVKGLPADHRSDIFSLGCVLYELATGRRAFHRDTAAETMTAILREDVPDPPRDSGVASAGLEPVIRHCLEKQPDERFQSARDLAFALQAATGSSSGTHVAALPSATMKGRWPVLPIAIGAALAVAAYFAGRAGLGSAGGSAAAVAGIFTQLTDAGGVETDPVISPDGTSVAYVTRHGKTSDIHVQRIGGRNPIVVAGDPSLNESSPAYSPDGTQVAFHVSGGRGGIFVAGATGESARRITDFGFHPAWSPDGQRLMFCAEEIEVPVSRTSTSALWLVDAKGGTPAKIFDGDAVQPVWSPSGSRVAFWAVQGGQRDIYTIAATGGERTPVTSDTAIDWKPQWSADGHLYFASNRGGAMNIWRLRVDEASGTPQGEPEPVTAGVTDAEQPSLSKDGSKLVFRASQGALNPAALPFDPVTKRIGELRLILDRTGSMTPSSVSPDGKWLAIWNIFERHEDVMIARTDGTELRRLTDDISRDRFPVWSRDGSEIVFYSNRDRNYGIWAIRPDGSGLRKIATQPPSDDKNLLYPVFSPEGDRMIASRVRAPESLLFDPRRTLDEQTPESLSLKFADGSWIIPTAWSGDGRRLAGQVVNQSGSGVGIGVYDMESRTPRLLSGSGSGFVNAVWLPDNRTILFVDTGAGTLSLVDADTSQRRDLLTGLFGIVVAIAPDARTIYLSVQRRQADVWMVTR